MTVKQLDFPWGGLAAGILVYFLLPIGLVYSICWLLLDKEGSSPLTIRHYYFGVFIICCVIVSSASHIANTIELFMPIKKDKED